jgi:hypothetical protein
MTGPRAQPPKDIRKSIMALRRMNSSLDIPEDKLSKGSHRYLRLGREASVQLPFDSSFSSDISDNGDDPPQDILPENDEDDDEAGSKECHFITYSPKKPTLSLLTTIPEASPTQLSVWENGEGYWAQTETGTPTPTASLNKMLGWQEETLTPSLTSGYSEQSFLSSEKEGLQILLEGEETTSWDDRKSRLLETTKSVRSLFDEQGFLISPLGEGR